MNLPPGATGFESNAGVAAIAVAVWGNGSSFVHTIASPSLIVIDAGLNVVPSMVTLCVTPAAASGRGIAISPNTATINRSARSLLAAKGRLHMLGVFEVRDERRTHLHE